jgi:ribosomal protein L33
MAKSKKKSAANPAAFLPEGYELTEFSKLRTQNIEENPSVRSADSTSSPQVDSASSPQAGLECKKCGCNHFYVGRTVTKGKKIYRYRYCRHCGKGITTEEREIG